MASVPLRNGFSEDDWCRDVAVACADLLDKPPSEIEYRAILPTPGTSWRTVDLLVAKRLLSIAERLWFSTIEESRPAVWRLKHHGRLPAERQLWKVLRDRALLHISLTRKWLEPLPLFIDGYSEWDQDDVLAYDLHRHVPWTLPVESPETIAAGVTGWAISADLLEDYLIGQAAIRPLRADLPTVAVIASLVDRLAMYRATAGGQSISAPAKRRTTPSTSKSKELYDRYAPVWQEWADKRAGSTDAEIKTNIRAFVEYLDSNPSLGSLAVSESTWRAIRADWDRNGITWPPREQAA